MMMPSDFQIHHVSGVELVQALDLAHPVKSIGKNESVDDAKWYAAQRELIDMLLAMIDEEVAERAEAAK